jgi:hypothetical protein
MKALPALLAMLAAACGPYLLELPRDEHGRHVVKNSDTKTLVFGRHPEGDRQVTITSTNGKVSTVECVLPSGALKAAGGGTTHWTCAKTDKPAGVKIVADRAAGPADVIVCLDDCDADDTQHFVHLFFEGK